jgi:hypothetical protein
MSGPVIIRLQNLPLEARSLDIRKFFEGLVIPDGGVHIIGGDRGDAFIAFHSDEDARQAMYRDNYELCNSKIKLYLSSKSEMQSVIAAARNTTTSASSSNLLAFNSSSNLNNVGAKPTNELLSSLTKLIGSNPVNSNNQSNSNLSNLSNLNSLLPTNKPQQTEVQQPQQPKLNIDQILNLLTNIKSDNSVISTLTATLPNILSQTKKPEASTSSNPFSSNSN